MKTELTPEESAKLIELGVDEELANEAQYTSKVKVIDGFTIDDFSLKKPIFTLTDILAILPKEIEGSDLAIIAKKNVWVVFYFGGKIRMIDTRVVAPELIDALNQLLIRCINNGHYNPKNEEK